MRLIKCDYCGAEKEWNSNLPNGWSELKTREECLASHLYESHVCPRCLPNKEGKKDDKSV